jgi:hypothetical protein
MAFRPTALSLGRRPSIVYSASCSLSPQHGVLVAAASKMHGKLVIAVESASARIACVLAPLVDRSFRSRLAKRRKPLREARKLFRRRWPARQKVSRDRERRRHNLLLK